MSASSGTVGYTSRHHLTVGAAPPPPPAGVGPGRVGVIGAGVIGAVVVMLAGCATPADPSTQPGRSGRSTTAGVSASATPETGFDPSTAPCPYGGFRIIAERGEAAMGYREMALQVDNCGSEVLHLGGQPDVVVLDEDQKRLDIAVVPSTHYTASRQITLQPGTRATAILSWRNTVTAGSSAVSGVFLSIGPVRGGPTQTVRLPSPLDLGNTGRLEVSAWF